MKVLKRLSETKEMIARYESIIKPYTSKDSLSSKQSTHARLKYYERTLKHYYSKELKTKKDIEVLEREYGYSEIELREAENKIRASFKNNFWFKNEYRSEEREF